MKPSALTAVLVLSTVGACKFQCSVGKRTGIDEAKLADFVRSNLAGVGDITSVTCPALEASKGAHVTCTIAFAQGPTRQASLTATSEQGDVTMALAVDLIDRAKLSARFIKMFAEQELALVALECPPNQPNVAGTSFACQGRLASGETVQFAALVPPSLQLDLEATTPLFDASKLSGVATAWARGNAGGTMVIADCGIGKHPVPGAGATWPCKVTIDGSVRELHVGLADLSAPTFAW